MEDNADAGDELFNVGPSEGPGGGFNPLGDDVKVDNVLIYIDSNDITVALGKAKSLGATILKEKSEIPGYGWFGVFKDPTGNSIALFTDMHPSLWRRFI